MNQTNRREFFRGAGSVAAAGLLAPLLSAASNTRMKMCLNTGNIGVRANLAESIAMAAKFGFDAVDPNTRELAALSDSGMSAMLDDLASRKLTFGSVAQAFPITGITPGTLWPMCSPSGTRISSPST